MLNRRDFVKVTGLLTGIGFTSVNGFARSLLQDDQYEVKMLRGNVGIFTARGGTVVWRIAEDGIAVVDTQFPPSAKQLIEEVKKRSERKIDYVINTHHHGDHSSGNIEFKGLADKIVAHANSKENQRNSAEKNGKLDEILLPDTTFDKTWKARLGSEKITATYFGPAHTNGDAIIHFENDNVAHMGDLHFHMRHPYIDKSTGASIENWIKVLDAAIDKYDNETIFVSGHAEPVNDLTGGKDRLRSKNAYLNTLLEVVGKEIKSGKSKEEIEKLPAIPGFDFPERGLSRNLGTAYDELTA